MAEVKMNEDTMAEALRQQYPSNSKTMQPKQERPKIEKVTSGRVVLQKESLRQKIKKAFLPKDVKDIKSYAINNVIIPGLKNGFLMLTELILFGETRRRTGLNVPYVSSRTNYSYISSNGQRMNNVAQPTSQQRGAHDFTWAVFETYQDAEEVISTLIDLVDRYGEARVSDYYDAAGVSADYVDDNWGWKAFRRLEPRRIAEGYVIDMEPPILLSR